MKPAFEHALVIGKFYPPHSGHEYLIRTAADASRQVTVVVMAADCESIPLERRVSWLTEIFASRPTVTVVGVVDNVPIDYGSDAIWQAHVDLMKLGVTDAERARTRPAGPIDAVFTSEAYGDELAHRLGAVAVCLDRNRELHRVSGTAVRGDVSRHWNELAPCVREALCQRVVIVGAESTGKSTLAAALAARLRERGSAWARTEWVAEFGREYTMNKLAVARALAARDGQTGLAVDDLHWQSAEFEVIATEQQGREDRAARTGGPVLICDTDAFATAIWHQRYVASRSEIVETIASHSPPRLGYILTGYAEVPFEQDGLRDGARIRGWMHDEFETRLASQSAAWTSVSGTLEQRLAQSIAWIDARLTDAWKFAAPLG